MATLAEKLKANRAQREESDQKNQKTIVRAAKTSSGSSGGNHDDLPEILAYIDVSDLNHEEWMKCGTALKKSGIPFEVFDAWSSRDTRQGEYQGTQHTLNQWNSFDVSSDVSSGYIVTLAEKYGYQKPERSNPGLSQDNSGNEPLLLGQMIRDERYVNNDNNESVIDFEDVGDILGTPYEIVPPIIDGLLDVGDVIVIAGDAGVGKSWMLLSLGFAVATGGEFMGMRCTRGRVCYVNPEIQSKKFRNRLRKYANTTGIIALDRESFEILNCRGTVPDVQGVRDKLKSQAGEFSIVLLDSIYMLNNANENDAQEMKQLFFEILGICQEKHTAVAFTHHNGKGATSKSVQDRMRGSSVFSGAPDVCLAVTKLYPKEGEHDGAIELLRTYDKRGDDGETVPAEALILRSTKVRDHAPMKNRYLIWQFPRFIEDVTGELEAALLQPKEQRQSSTKEDENKALVEIVRELIEDGKPTDAESVMVRFNDWIRENIDPDKTKGADTVKRYCREGKYTGVTWDKQAKRFTIPTLTDDD